ncbi:MAG: serine hydrolase domain-containing protein [Bryobacteraceae bacterium]|jgi:CubicO group peptidase (beta-lactamase class C family)
MRRLFPLALILLAALPVTPQAPVETGLDPTRLKLIPVRLRELVENQTIPGAVALVARHGEIASLDAEGWRDIEGRKPMTTDSIFQIMSMTKQFTGVGAMMLVEEGKLELRRPIEDYLPEFRGQVVDERLPNGNMTTHAPARPPTVWQLMCHTSGLAENPDGELSDNLRTMRVPLDEAVRFYATRHLQFEPGTRWRYSNMGIATLGRIIEKVSGEEYVHFIESRILKPLGMSDTFFFAPPGKRDRIALVYKHEGGKLVRAGDEILAGDPTKYRAGARYPGPELGLYSTAGDLVKFYQMLLSGGEYQGHRYLSRQAIDTMTRVFTPGVDPSGWLGGTGYGLTFEIVDKPEGTLLLHSPGTFGHGGAFGTEGWVDRHNDLIRILLVQVSDGSGGPARAVVMQLGEAAVR